MAARKYQSDVVPISWNRKGLGGYSRPTIPQRTEMLDRARGVGSMGATSGLDFWDGAAHFRQSVRGHPGGADRHGTFIGRSRHTARDFCQVTGKRSGGGFAPTREGQNFHGFACIASAERRAATRNPAIAEASCRNT